MDCWRPRFHLTFHQPVPRSAFPGDSEHSVPWAPTSPSLSWGKGLRPNLVSPIGQGIKNSNYDTLLSSNRHFVIWIYLFACTGLWYLLVHLLSFPAAWGVGCFSVYSAENKSKLLFCVSVSFQLMHFWNLYLCSSVRWKVLKFRYSSRTR